MVRAKHWYVSDSEDEFGGNGLSEEENECVTPSCSDPPMGRKSMDEQDKNTKKRKSSDSLGHPSKKSKNGQTLGYTIKRRKFPVKDNNKPLQKGKEKAKKKCWHCVEFKVRILTESVVQISDVSKSLYLTFQKILSEILSGFPSSSLVQVCVSSSSLSHPISTKVLKSTVFSSEHIMTTIENAVQSASEGICLNSSFQVTVKVLDTQTGGSLGPKLKENLSTNCKNIITIEDDDNISMARAIVVALAKLRKDPKFKYLWNSKKPLQKKLAKELHQNAGIPEGYCGIEEAKVFANHLGIKITIVDPELEQKMISVGQENESEVYLWRIPQDEKYHYNVITTINSILKNRKTKPLAADKVSPRHIWVDKKAILRKIRTFLVKELSNIQKYYCEQCKLRLEDRDSHECEILSKKELITVQKVDNAYRDLLKDENLLKRFMSTYPEISGAVFDPIWLSVESNWGLWYEISSYVKECEIVSKDGDLALHQFMEEYEC